MPGAPGSTPVSRIAISTPRPSYSGNLVRKDVAPVSFLGSSPWKGNGSSWEWAAMIQGATMKTKRGRRGATRWERERGGELAKGGGQGIPSSLLFFLGYIYNAVSFFKNSYPCGSSPSSVDHTCRRKAVKSRFYNLEFRVQFTYQVAVCSNYILHMLFLTHKTTQTETRRVLKQLGIVQHISWSDTWTRLLSRLW